MKANRKFRDGEEAVSAVIGVILMVAITVAIAATVYVYVGGLLGTSPTASATISMVAKSGYVEITGVQNGPVTYASTTLKILDSTGTNSTSNPSVTWGEHSGTNVAGGDTISVTAGSATSGAVYTVQIVSSTNVLGEVPYTIP